MERGLGKDQRTRSAHVGSTSAEAEVEDVYSACVEVKLDGPRYEWEMFQPSPEGVLLFTPFSRTCAMLWIARNGRRFACYQERKDKGTQKHHALPNSDKAVQLRARKA